MYVFRTLLAPWGPVLRPKSRQGNHTSNDTKMTSQRGQIIPLDTKTSYYSYVAKSEIVILSMLLTDNISYVKIFSF